MVTTEADEESSLTVQLMVPAESGAPRLPLMISSRSVSSTELRALVATKTGIPLDKLKLIFGGRLIKDDGNCKVVDDYNIQDGSVLHCMGKPVKKSSPANNNSVPAASATAASASATTAAAASGPTASIQPNAASTNLMPPTTSNSLDSALNTLRSTTNPAQYLEAVKTMEKILSNITDNPMEEKYRRVKKQNAAFQRRLGGLQGGDAVMKAAGFVVEGEVYQMRATPQAWPALMAAKATLSNAVKEAKTASSSSAAPPPFHNMPTAAPVGQGGMIPPNAANMAANLMSDPAALQTMMQNPFVQQMLGNDPQLQAAMQQLQSNPAMANQLSQMMRDPATQQRMQALMQQGGVGGSMNNNNTGMGGLAGMMNNSGSGNNSSGMQSSSSAPPASSGNATATQPQHQQQQGGSDQQATEEEMIAEAIRRSLQES